jgi:hypothetical protein
MRSMYGLACPDIKAHATALCGNIGTIPDAAMHTLSTHMDMPKFASMISA